MSLTDDLRRSRETLRSSENRGGFFAEGSPEGLAFNRSRELREALPLLEVAVRQTILDDTPEIKVDPTAAVQPGIEQYQVPLATVVEKPALPTTETEARLSVDQIRARIAAMPVEQRMLNQ